MVRHRNSSTLQAHGQRARIRTPPPNGTRRNTATPSAEELRIIFGPKIAAIVLEVTDDKQLSKDERKKRQVEHSPHLSRPAKLVKLADKICNLRDILESPPADWPAVRKQEYFDWASKVVDGLRGTNSRLERTFDELVERKVEIK